MEIGSNTAPGSFANFAGHAIAGCAAGALRADGGCGAGALGAVLGEATALTLNGNRSAEDILANGVLPGTNELASVVGAVGVALAGGDARQINVAAGAAGNAAENNAAGQVRFLADSVLRLAQGGWQSVGAAGQAALLRCAAAAWCASLPMVAGAVQIINDAQRLANQPSAADLIPTGYGGGLPPQPMGPLVNPAPQPTQGSTTTTPGDVLSGSGAPGYTSPNPVGNSSTTTVNNGPGGATVVMSLGSEGKGVVGTNGGTVNPALLNELTTNGVKFTPENVIATARSPSGQVVFLETGNSASGLKHIVQEHATDFANIGISEAQIPSVVTRAVSEGNIVVIRDLEQVVRFTK